jgi:hypothetical protein
MALAASQIESIREMVGDKTFDTIESLCAELNPAQESAMAKDVIEWDAVKNKQLKVKGGDDGIDLDYSRSRHDLKNRVRDRLGLPSLSSGGLVRINVGYGYSDPCDALGNA